MTDEAELAPGEFAIGSSIPVVRMLYEAKAKAFYVDFLGFEIEWVHRFSDTAPLYMQIRLGDSVIHLNGHAEEDAPITEVRIPVRGIDAFCEHLRAKLMSGPKPSLVDPRYEGEGTDMNIYDPSGNLLVFWRR
jgi:hypothetical protein